MVDKPFGPEPSVFSSAVKNVKVRIYKTTILPVVLYVCETWSPTLREEYGLRGFENRVLRRIFGLKRDVVTRGWRKLHNEEDEVGGTCDMDGREEEHVHVIGRKARGKETTRKAKT
jgi:hypothetical protein